MNESRERSSYCFMMFSATESREAQFSYEVDMRHFKELTQPDFQKYRAIAGDDLLDEWYKKYGVRKLLNRIIGQ